MKNTEFVRRLLKNTSRGLFFTAGLGVLYIAFPIFEGQSEVASLSKNSYAVNSELIRKHGLTAQDFQAKPLLTSALLHLEAADSVLQSGRSFDYKFSNSWALSDATVRLFTTPAVGSMGLIYASCEGASRTVLGLAAQANTGYTAQQATAFDNTSSQATTPEALKGGVNLSEQDNRISLLEVNAKPWWDAPKIFSLKNGADKRPELLKSFPGLDLNCTLANKSSAKLSSLTETLPELAALGAWQEPKTNLPATISIPTLGLETVTVKPAPDGMAGTQLTLVVHGKSEQDAKRFQSAYEKAKDIFASKAPLKALHAGHQDGKQNARAEFALVDGTVVIGWESGLEPGFKVLLQPELPTSSKK